MNASPDAFRDSVRVALTELADPPLAARFAAPLVTALIADAREDDRTDAALSEVIAGLARVGLPRGRMFVLLGSPTPDAGNALERARARALALALAVPVLLHDPHAAAFTVGRLEDGTPVALDDELREAEAIVSVGACDASHGTLEGGPFLLCPGVAAAATRDCFSSARSRLGMTGAMAFAAGVERLVPLDLAVWWPFDGPAFAASGRDAHARALRATGLA